MVPTAQTPDEVQAVIQAAVERALYERDHPAPIVRTAPDQAEYLLKLLANIDNGEQHRNTARVFNETLLLLLDHIVQHIDTLKGA